MKLRFGPLYILANFGAHVAFMPLLVLLLPRRVEAIADGAPLVLLSQLLLLGGITASLAHIASGTFSDRWLERAGDRRGPIGIGLSALIASYALFAHAMTPAALAVALVLFQVSLNIMFAPLGALLADHVPDQRKGWIAGWLNMALPLSGLAITLIGYVSLRDAVWPFGVLAGVICLAVLPLLAFWPRGLVLLERTQDTIAAHGLPKRDFVFAWLARLAIQTGAAVILSYLYLYVDTLARSADGYAAGPTSSGVATLSLIATLVALGAGIMAGRWSDRNGVRKRPLTLSALVVSVALALLSWGSDWRVILLAYTLFTAGLTAFLSVDSAMVAQLIAGHRRRGFFLGLMNLTNTLPSIIAPASALLLVSIDLGGSTLRVLLACAAVVAGSAALAVRGIRSVQ